MHMKERATYRCKSRRCGSLSSTRLPRVRPIATRKRRNDRMSDDTDKSGASSLKRPSTSSDQRASTDPEQRPSASSPQRGPSTSSQAQPSTRSQRRTKHKDHESCVNLMSQTLLSVAAKLEKVFNDSENPYPKVKRVYVIRFDDKASGSKKGLKKYTRVLYGRNPRGKETMKRAARCPTWARSPSPGSVEAGTRSHSTSDDRSGDPSQTDGQLYNHKAHEKELYHSERKKISRPREEPQAENRYSLGTSSNNQHRNIHVDKAQNNQHVVNLEKGPKKAEIADIFRAIFSEIGNLSSKTEGRPSPPKKKTLSQIIDSNESLVSSNYTIPPSMINKDAIDVLQALIDHKNKSRKRGREDRKSRRSNQKFGSPSRPFNAMECFVMRQPWSYQAEAINEVESNIGASSSVASGPICRICHERLGTLVRPCRCRGSMAYVHVECLQMWLTEKGINYCEVCYYVFRVIHVPEYKLIPSIGFWYKFAATNQQRKRILVDLTLAVILLPVLIFVTLFARSWNPGFPAADFDEDMEYDDTLPNLGWMLLVYAFKLFSFLLNMLYVAAVLVRINHHLATWLSWYVNKNVTVVLEDRRPGSARPAGYGDDGHRSTPE